MTAFALYLPERHGFSRWMLAAAIILAAHGALIGAIGFWHTHQPVEPNIVPAIAVTMAPVEASAPTIQDQDIAVGPTMQQAEAVPKEERKVEEKPLEQVVQPPPPQQQADVTLPREEQKVEKPEPQPVAPAPETRALPKNSRIGEFTEAGSNAYNALVVGHLEKFKRYPAAAHGSSGTVMVRFALNRAGEVISSDISKSSGNSVLDREALAILRRASPFPPFPAAKPGTQASYLWPMHFSR
ncbi:TonB family protein [Bradyrhizobium sp.]|uniref:TonB family protein n=1 Tax=Bradyrhizobium sp. TaxID=376 RepID=UPI0023929259|nr:TonB family protein [Bradyrhizobium sp.]MDE1935843.1 energy transducer TonB [Bradyrhizobium sp.]MDE2063014.1 energy transducer TonB [Bradyrhizobium sp.]